MSGGLSLSSHRVTRTRTRKTGIAGFTLVELLVVVTLISLLAVMALPRYARTREKAYRSQMQTALKTLVSAQEAYFEENYAYSNDITQLEQSQTQWVTLVIVQVSGNGWSAKATHSKTPIECGVYLGTVAAVAGIPDLGDGVISCT